jgi:hypothetical protein
VLLAIGMDANRNYDHYVEGHSPKMIALEASMATTGRPREHGAQPGSFSLWSSQSMETLGYLQTPLIA